MLQVLPQFHVGGWNVQPLLAWWKGATVVLEPAFDPARALALIAEKHVTTMMGVPATYLFMSQDPGFAHADLWSLRRAVVGGAPMPEALLEAWHERGVEIVQGYGLTEAAPNVLCLPPEDAARKRGYAGKPYPHVDVALRDPESGDLLDGAAEGELVVRGPNVFAGYWRNPEATAAAFADGWLLTGDIAARDDEGYYRIVGRTKDMVISGGENVYPAEIENVLHEHDAVARSRRRRRSRRALGRGLSRLRRPARRPRTEDELLELCRGRLARYKVPRGIRFVESLPRNALDKVVKSELAGARPMKALTARRRAHAPEAARGGGADLRRARLPRRLDRQDHRGGRRRPGHLLPLLRGKKQVFDEVVLDLNSRVRHAMTEASERGTTRAERELLGFGAFFRFTAEHPALYRIIRQAEFVSPETLADALRAADRGLRRRASARRWRRARSPRPTPRCSRGA